MAVTIVADVGAANANSYVTLARAEEIADERLHTSVWDGADEDTKNRSLVWAAKLIDRTIKWNGSRASETQALEWPRTGLKWSGGKDVPSDAVPNVIQEMQFELAMLLISTDRTLENEVSAQGITSIKAGPVGLTFKDTIETPKAVPDTMMTYIPRGWVERSIPYPLVVS